MLKQTFKDQIEFDIYLTEQKIRMEKGFLTRSEREQLNKILDKNYKPIFIKEELPKPKIVTDINELRKPCLDVTKEDNIKEIIQKLKDAHEACGGLGISANQLGIQKRVSYIKIPKFVDKNKELQFNEYIFINPKIIEKDKSIKVRGEGCLSFPGVFVDTLRYVFCTIEYLDENLKPQTGILQDTESIAAQHEIDHTNGKLIFDNRWRTK